MPGIDRRFERRGTRNRSRRIRTSGTKLIVTIGLAGYEEKTFTQTFKSAGQAARAAERWATWALNDGFAEVQLPNGLLGQVSTLESPGGPGRVRTDSRRDVYFDRPAASPNTFKVGDRVIVEGASKDSRLKVDYLFGSKLRTSRVFPFPAVDWKRHKVAADLATAVRRKLISTIGDTIDGFHLYPSRMKPVPLGTLIFTYDRGIYRFLGATKDRAGNAAMVTYEPVFSSKLTRLNGEMLRCGSEGCKPVPRAIARELQAFLDTPRETGSINPVSASVSRTSRASETPSRARRRTR